MTTTTEHHDAGGESHSGEELFVAKGHHGASDKQYIIVAVILAAITAMEVTLTYLDVGWIFLPALLVLMTAKFLMVVSFFMHLKFDHRLFSFLFYAGLTLAVFVYIAALATFSFFGS